MFSPHLPHLSLVVSDVFSIGIVHIGAIRVAEGQRTETVTMADEKWTRQLRSGEPASYRITVEGSLDEKWSGRLGGMQIATEKRGGQKPVTILSGQVRDQAALMGVLNSLYDLHLKILSVNCETANETIHNSMNGGRK
jgi:hypothetical protein